MDNQFINDISRNRLKTDARMFRRSFAQALKFGEHAPDVLLFDKYALEYAAMGLDVRAIKLESKPPKIRESDTVDAVEFYIDEEMSSETAPVTINGNTMYQVTRKHSADTVILFCKIAPEKYLVARV